MTPADRTRALVLRVVADATATTGDGVTAQHVAWLCSRSTAHMRAILSRLTTTGELVAERRGQTYYYRPKEQAP